MKVLECKVCEKEVEVPENRVSVLCAACARNQSLKKDLQAAIETQESKIEQCNPKALITKRKMGEVLEMLYILLAQSDSMSKEVRDFAEVFARGISK